MSVDAHRLSQGEVFDCLRTRKRESAKGTRQFTTETQRHGDPDKNDRPERLCCLRLFSMCLLSDSVSLSLCGEFRPDLAFSRQSFEFVSLCPCQARRWAQK